VLQMVMTIDVERYVENCDVDENADG